MITTPQKRVASDDGPSLVEIAPPPGLEKESREHGGRARRSPLGFWWILCVLVVGVLGADFGRRAIREESATRFPFAWTARWVQSPAAGSIICFRKAVTVSGHVQNAYIIVGADNAYNLVVNGASVAGHFRTVNSYALERLHSTYNMVGYPAHWDVAHVFNLQPLLQPGRNVISVTVQSDGERPSFIAEGNITAGGTTHLISDGSWKCSPDTQKNWRTSWSSAEIFDAQWPHAVAATAPRPLPTIDGDLGALTTPLRGAFITTATQVESTVTYRRRFLSDSSYASGWLRVVTRVPFDVSLNGIKVASTSQVSRKWPGDVSRRSGMDQLPRLFMGAKIGRYPSLSRKYRANTVFLVRSIRRGWNTVEITTHDTAGLVSRGTMSAIAVDGVIRAQGGGTQQLQSGPQWEASAGGRSLGACVVTATPRGIGVFDTATYTARPSTRVGPQVAGGGRLMLTLLLLSFGLSLAVTALAVFLGRFLPGRPVIALRNAVTAPALILFCAALLETSFEASLEGPTLDKPLACRIALGAAAAAWALLIAAIIGRSLFSGWRGKPAPDASFHWQSAPGQIVPDRVPVREGQASGGLRWLTWVILGAILILGAMLYGRGLGSYGYLPDEYVSMLAARGIARHGIPIFEHSGLIYTRSGLFHYLLAPFVGASGDPNPYLVRGIAGVWQLATILLVFYFGRAVRSSAVGLTAALFVAFSPMMVFCAREVRFYTEEAFFMTLSLFFLWRAVRDPEDSKARILTWVCFMAAYLSQQLALAVLPSIFLVILVNRRVHAWCKGWTLAFMLLSFGVMAADFLAYTHWCQTALPFVDSDSILLIGLHTDILEAVPSMLLLGHERTHIVVGGLYLLGLLGVMWASRKRSPAPTPLENPVGPFLYLVSLPLIIMTTLITPRPAERYAIQAFPILAIAAAFALSVIVGHLRQALKSPLPGKKRVWDLATVIGVLLVGLCLFCYRPVRVWQNCTQAMIAGVTPATRYVRMAAQPGDKTVFFSPEAATLDIGGCDYFWHSNSSSIYIYKSSDGVLRERNSGAVFLDTTDKLNGVMANHRRVWLVIPQWQTLFTGAAGNRQAFSNFLNSNFALLYQVHGIQVWLWDRDQNHYRQTVHQFQSEGPGYSDED